MKRILAFLLSALMMTGCSSPSAPEAPASQATFPAVESVSSEPAITEATGTSYQSRFDTETLIHLSDDGIQISPSQDHENDVSVTVTHDIIYYEDRETYDSGNPYGEGSAEERHSADEAAAHSVVNITQPGVYRVTGKLSAGQIRIDLGDEAYRDKNAVVELILQDTDITCTVAPAILFLNTYECDGNWSTETAKAEIDTAAAGANLILEGHNTVSGSHVAKIFKDTDEEKKLWKQDAAIYSYMSMNVYGPGSLELTADNEGLDTELHLTINGGNIHIDSGNDGINTNEDGVSVTTINDGNVTIFAGLGKEGDGIDSNGYLVINGGTVVASAKPSGDAGLDSDLGSFINGGTVIAMGSTMNWAESNSNQVTMNLQFASQQKAGSKITITRKDGTEVFSFDTAGKYARDYSGLVLSHASLTQGETYHVYIDGVQMGFTGTDVGRGHGGKGRPGGMRFPEGEIPEGMELPEDFDHSQFTGRMPDQENRTPPEAFDGERPERKEPLENFDPNHFFDEQNSTTGEIQTDFYMNDKVNSFSGVTAA